jgi:cellulose synthase/poly-beta-1,6-N-acetylglucosamine synthase-like glycosyltransferase
MYLFPGNLTNLQQLVLFTVAMVTGLISIYAFNMWILTLLSLRGRNKLAAPPSLETWPKVSVHLPLFNEERVAGRLVEACAKLDYPADKLEIIVMDDSFDGTTRITLNF